MEIAAGTEPAAGARQQRSTRRPRAIRSSSARWFACSPARADSRPAPAVPAIPQGVRDVVGRRLDRLCRRANRALCGRRRRSAATSSPRCWRGWWSRIGQSGAARWRRPRAHQLVGETLPGTLSVRARAGAGDALRGAERCPATGAPQPGSRPRSRSSTASIRTRLERRLCAELAHHFSEAGAARRSAQGGRLRHPRGRAGGRAARLRGGRGAVRRALEALALVRRGARRAR